MNILVFAPNRHINYHLRFKKSSISKRSLSFHALNPVNWLEINFKVLFRFFVGDKKFRCELRYEIQNKNEKQFYWLINKNFFNNIKKSENPPMTSNIESLWLWINFERFFFVNSNLWCKIVFIINLQNFVHLFPIFLAKYGFRIF